LRRGAKAAAPPPVGGVGASVVVGAAVLVVVVDAVSPVDVVEDAAVSAGIELGFSVLVGSAVVVPP